MFRSRHRPKKPLPGLLKYHFELVAIEEGNKAFIHIYILLGLYWVPLELHVPHFEKHGPTDKFSAPVYSI